MSSRSNDCDLTNHRAVKEPWEITHYFKSKIKTNKKTKHYNHNNNKQSKPCNNRCNKKNPKHQGKLTNHGFQIINKKTKTKTQTGNKWGDNDAKSPATLRITSHNIQRMLLDKRLQKNKIIMQTLQGKDQSDIHLYQEIGINWQRIGKSNNWKSRTQNLKGRMKHQLAYNTHQEGDNPVQYGGVLISTNNKPVNWITDQTYFVEN